MKRGGGGQKQTTLFSAISSPNTVVDDYPGLKPRRYSFRVYAATEVVIWSYALCNIKNI